MKKDEIEFIFFRLYQFLNELDVYMLDSEIIKILENMGEFVFNLEVEKFFL